MSEEHFNYSLPPFFLNSIPKSGTHLIKQVLLGIPSVIHDPINHMYEGLPSHLSQHKKILEEVKSNEFASGHIYYSEKWESLLSSLKMKQIFMIRDPRDVLISFYYYLDMLPHFGLFEYMDKKKMSKKERILSIINGVQVPELDYPDIKKWFNLFLGWINTPLVLTIKYEDLNSSSEFIRLNTIKKIANFLMDDMPSYELEYITTCMAANIAPTSSPTFRKGTIGGWITEFDEEMKQDFKAVTGDLLIRMDYEKTLNW